MPPLNIFLDYDRDDRKTFVDPPQGVHPDIVQRFLDERWSYSDLEEMSGFARYYKQFKAQLHQLDSRGGVWYLYWNFDKTEPDVEHSLHSTLDHLVQDISNIGLLPCKYNNRLPRDVYLLGQFHKDATCHLATWPSEKPGHQFKDNIAGSRSMYSGWDFWKSLDLCPTGLYANADAFLCSPSFLHGPLLGRIMHSMSLLEHILDHFVTMARKSNYRCDISLHQVSPPLFLNRRADFTQVNNLSKRDEQNFILCVPDAQQGFANRMNTIANAIYVARMYGVRVVIVWLPSQWCNGNLCDVIDVHTWKSHYHFIEVYNAMPDLSTLSGIQIGDCITHFACHTQFVTWTHQSLKQICESLGHPVPDNSLAKTVMPSLMTWSQKVVDRASEIMSHWKEKERLDDIPWYRVCGFHIRRGDMQAMHQSHYHGRTDWNAEYELIMWYVKQKHEEGWYCFLATDDVTVLEDMRKTWHPSLPSKIWLSSLGVDYIMNCVRPPGGNPQWLEDRKQSGLLRQTDLLSFGADMWILSQCKHIFGCRYSSVKHILRASKKEDATMKELGKTCPQAWNGVPMKCQEAMIKWYRSTAEDLFWHQQFSLPHMQLTDRHERLLMRITDAETLHIYEDFHLTFAASLYPGSKSIPLSLLGLNRLPFAAKLNNIKNDWRILDEELRNAKAFADPSKHHPRFMSALIWTVLRYHARSEHKPCFLSIGDQVVQVPQDDVSLVTYWYTSFMKEKRTGAMDSNAWRRVIAEFFGENSEGRSKAWHSFRLDHAWKVKHGQNAALTPIRARDQIALAFESWSHSPTMADDAYDPSVHMGRPVNAQPLWWKGAAEEF